MTADNSPALGGQPVDDAPMLGGKYHLLLIDYDGLMALTWDDILAMGPDEEDRRIAELKLLARYSDNLDFKESLFYRYIAGLAYPPGSIMYERERQYQEYREAVEELKEAIAETFYPALDIAVKVANWLGIK